MPQTRKIATCCYCGTRAVLTLDMSRHELACAACGAPLHNMKAMPVPQQPARKRAAAAPQPAFHPVKSAGYRLERREKPYRKKDKRRKRKPLSRKIFEELWDVVEEIFD